jgi:hypothetical protein
MIAGISPAELSTRISWRHQRAHRRQRPPLAIYADLYAQDSTMGVYRSMHLATAEQAGLDHFLYTGTIIGGARKFCHDNLGHIYNRAETATMDNMSWHGNSAPPPHDQLRRLQLPPPLASRRSGMAEGPLGGRTRLPGQ